MHKISIDPPKTIVKKRQQCACDSCRKSKKRCDGESPCARCKRNNKPCLYSPQKKRTSANSISPTESTTSNNNDKLPVIPAVPVPTSTALVNPQISQQPYPREISEYPTFSETAMVDLLIKNKYIEAYFTIINPQCSFICPKETMLFIENPTKPSARLQLSCILATTSRTFGEYSLSTYFENRAKVIAKEVFDEFTPEAALGFALLSGCLWASDRTSTAHYRDITLSIIKRVRNKGKSSKKLLDRLLRIEMAVAAYPDNDKSETLAECRELAEKIRKFIATEDKEYDALVSSDSASQQMLPIPHFLTMLEFRAKFYEAVLENNPNANIYEKGFNPFRTLDKPTSEELFVLVRDCSKLISFIYRHTPHYPLIFSLLLSYEAILYYASGDPARAVATIRYVVHNLLIHVSLIRFLNPFVAGGLHFMFLICIYQKEFALARDVLNFLALVAAHLPVAQDLLEQNEDVFRSSQAEATDSGERLSNSFSPPQVSIEELPPDSLAMQYSVWSSNWNPPRIATSASNQFKPVSQPNPADHVPLSAVYANGGSFPEGFSPSLGSSQPSPSSSQPSPVANFSQPSPGSIYSPASPANGLHSYTQASPVVYSSSSPSSPGTSPYSPGSSPSLSSPSQPPSPNQGSRVPLFQQVLTQQLPTAPQHSVPAQQQVPAHVRSQFSPSSYSNNSGPGISLAHHGVHPDYKSQKIYAPLTPGMHDFPEFSTQMAGSVTSWHPSFCAPQSESPDFDPETGLEFSGFEFLNTL